VLLCAADTFRAAAIEQLEVWAQRTGARSHQAASRRGPERGRVRRRPGRESPQADYVIVDTAGRLQHETNLMAELEKMRRTVARVIPSAPHEVLLVIEATTGQNGLEQARKFTETSAVTGIILTKLDAPRKAASVIANFARAQPADPLCGRRRAARRSSAVRSAAFVGSLFDE